MDGLPLLGPSHLVLVPPAFCAQRLLQRLHALQAVLSGEALAAWRLGVFSDGLVAQEGRQVVIICFFRNHFAEHGVLVAFGGELELIEEVAFLGARLRGKIGTGDGFLAGLNVD